ncbi:MAG: hypothetical protein HQK51_10520 [Oligoflexia bacterium]|nr:hypothetical protein [Oligoflexia bacterium]
MSYQSIIEYLEALSRIYLNSNKKEKSKLLDHVVLVTGFHRKSITRALNNGKLFINNRKGSSGTKTQYPSDLLLPHVEYL